MWFLPSRAWSSAGRRWCLWPGCPLTGSPPVVSLPPSGKCVVNIMQPNVTPPPRPPFRMDLFYSGWHGVAFTDVSLCLVWLSNNTNVALLCPRQQSFLFTQLCLREPLETRASSVKQEHGNKVLTAGMCVHCATCTNLATPPPCVRRQVSFIFINSGQIVFGRNLIRLHVLQRSVISSTTFYQLGKFF